MSDHDQPVADNLLARRFDAEVPNQRSTGDATELRIGESGRLFLAVIIDLFSRFAIRWALSAVNDRHLAHQGPADGGPAALPRRGAAPPLGSGQSVRERGLPEGAGGQAGSSAA
jgi:transposase InsO family protein